MKKRLMSLLLTAAMIVSMVAVPVAAADPTTITVGSGSAQPGQEVTIPVNITNVGEQKISSLGYSVTYNPEYLSVKSAAGTNSKWSHGMFMPTDNGKGTIKVADVAMPTQEYTGDDEMLTITFTLANGISEISEIPVTISIDQIMVNGTNIKNDVATVNGAITVIYPVTVTTGEVNQTSATKATLNASYTTVDSSITGVTTGILYGADQNSMTEDVAFGAEIEKTSDSFSYQAYADYNGTRYFGAPVDYTWEVAAVDTISVKGDKTSIEVPDETAQFTAEVKDQFGDLMDAKVTWSVENCENVAITADGVLSTNKETQSQVVTVIASYGEKTGSTTISIVRPDPVLKSMTIANGENTESATIAVPTLGEFTANGASSVDLSVSGVDQFDFESEVKDPMWSVTKADGSAAKGVSIDAQGIVAVDNTAEAGELTVTAKSGTVSDTFKVIITKADSKAETVTIVDPVTSGEIVADANTEFTYAVEVIDQFGAKVENPDITWNANSDKVDIVSMADGKLTVKAGSPAGTVTITAACGDVSSDPVTLSLSRAGAYTVSVVATSQDSQLVLPAIGGKDVTTQFTATITDNWNDVFENASVTWALVEDAVGVSIDENGKLTVTEKAEVGTIQIVAISKDNKTESDPVTVLIYKADPIATSIAFTSGSATLTTPTGDTPKTETYVATVYDQYGDIISTADPSYGFAPVEGQTPDTNVTAENNTVCVTSEAVADYSYVMTATYEGLSIEMTITVVDIEVAFTITAKETATYGTPWNKIVTKVSGTATLDGDTVKGVYSLIDGTVIPDVGSNEYSVQFVSTEKAADGETPLYTVIMTGTQAGYGPVEITAKSLTLNWTAPKSITYTGEAPAITAAIKSDVISGDDVAVSVSGLVADAGAHTATATLTGSDAGNYVLAESTATKNYSIAKAKATLSLPPIAAFKAEQGDVADANLLAMIGAEQTAQGVGDETVPGTLTLAESIVSVKAGTTKNVKVKFEHNDPNYVPFIETTVKVTFTDGDPQDITFDIDTAQAAYGETIEADAYLAKNASEGGGAITYTSSNPSVAAVDPNTGALTIGVVGEATITATAAKVPGQWAESFDQYTITVAPKSISIKDAKVASEKLYDGTTSIAITDYGTLEGVLDKDNGLVTIDTTNAAANFVDGPNASETAKSVAFTGFALTGDAAENYVLTAQPAPTTAKINKSNAAISLGNLTQSVRNESSITPVTATVYPADENNEIIENSAAVTDAPTIIEYEVVVEEAKDAVAGVDCDHVGEKLCENVDPETGLCLHGTCGCSYVEEQPAVEAVTEWVTEVPAAVGTYNVRAFIKTEYTSDSLNLTKTSEEIDGYCVASGTLTITKRSSSGGGGGGGSTVTPPVVEVPEINFVDVEESDWFYDYVIEAVEKGLFAGTDDTHFSPDMKMNRAMMVTVMAALEFGAEGAPEGESDFTDLTADWYKNAVAWAADEKVTAGISDTEFGPDLALTREQVAVFLYAYAQLKGYDVSAGSINDIVSFNDIADLSAWASTAMQWACAEGLLEGTPDGDLLPKAVATRAQVAVILVNFAKLING